VDRGALKAIIVHYVLDDRQYRRFLLIGAGHVAVAVFVLTILVLLGKVPALFLLIVSSSLSAGMGIGAGLLVAGLIQREKAEGSFRVFRALPLKTETLFVGAVLAGIVASIPAVLPLYVSATVGLLLRGGNLLNFHFYVGWIVLVMIFFSVSVSVTIALCVNSPGVIVNVLGVGSAVVGMLLSLQALFDIVRFSEEELFRLLRFVLSFEGQAVISGVVILLSGAVVVVGSWVFSHKRSYV
jgi:hypothetical protein